MNDKVTTLVRPLLVLLVALVALVVAGYSQEAAPAAPATPAPVVVENPPKLADAQALQIRNAQLEMYKTGLNFQNAQNACQTAVELRQSFNRQLSEVQALSERLVKKSGVDQEKWELDSETLVFRAKAPVPKPAPPPAAKAVKKELPPAKQQ